MLFLYLLSTNITDFPRETPRITGHDRAYKLNEPLDVNCSSAKSFPAPDLQWLIDGQKVCWVIFINTFKLEIRLWHKEQALTTVDIPMYKITS